MNGYGRGEDIHSVKEAAPVAKANRVEYYRGKLTEWYENGPIGLEQGFTVESSPATGEGFLTLTLDMTGNMEAKVDSGAKGLLLSGHDGKALLHYRGLTAIDASGDELRSWLEVKGKQLLVKVDDARARYPVMIDPFVQTAKLTASDGAAFDNFGYAVGISDDTVVVGALNDDIGSNSNQGSAYVFVRPAGGWADMTQTAKLTASDGAASDEFGWAVGISGNTVVVGAPFHTIDSIFFAGSAYIFERPAGGWVDMTETQMLTASDGAAFDFLGWAVGISGNTVVVGAPNADVVTGSDEGAAYIFQSPTPAPIPTLNEWGMILFIFLSGLGAVYSLRRQKRV